MCAELPDYSGEHFAITAIWRLLLARLKFGVEVENFALSNVYPLVPQQRGKIADDTCFPVDQRAVAIEREVVELCEIEHRLAYRPNQFSLPPESAYSMRTSVAAHRGVPRTSVSKQSPVQVRKRDSCRLLRTSRRQRARPKPLAPVLPVVSPGTSGCSTGAASARGCTWATLFRVRPRVRIARACSPFWSRGRRDNAASAPLGTWAAWAIQTHTDRGG